MPSTADPGNGAPAAFEPAGPGPRAVLTVLTEEELGQYEAIARDQVDRESRWRWVLTVVGLLAVPLAAWGLLRGLQTGFGRLAFGILGLAALMGYVPYRVAKARQMWQSHLDAISTERARRGVGGSAGVAGEGR